jgi:hypothetical protein
MRALRDYQPSRCCALGVVLRNQRRWKAAWTTGASEGRHDDAVGEAHVSYFEGGEEFASFLNGAHDGSILLRKIN